MKLNKYLVVGIVLAVVVGVALGINAYVGEKVKVAVAMEKVRRSEVDKADLTKQILDARTLINETEVALESSRQARIAREKEFQATLAHVQVATPTQLVDQGSTILGVTDIATDGTKVSMSVETYRKVVLALVDDQEYKNIKEPRWRADEVLYKAEISDWKVRDIKRDQKDALNESIIVSLKDVISHQKTATFFEKLAWGGIGFAAGAVFGKVK